MRDPFKSGLIPTSLIAHDLVPVRPSDVEDLGFVAMGFYIQPGGVVRFKAASGEVRTFPVVVNNFQLDVAATQIFATGTERGNVSPYVNNDPAHPDYDVWIWAKKPYAP